MRLKLCLILLFLCCSLFAQQENTQKKGKLFRIRTYKPIYFLLANHTTNINTNPTSSNPLNNVIDRQFLDDTELKFQLSFKAKLGRIEKIFGIDVNADTWIAYTQTSRWQVYNTAQSRPFRETNYEPEVFVQIPFDSESEKWKGIYWGFGLNHQSNGRSLPFSRSWNRLIFQLGIERDNYFILVKPWLRIQEDILEDDNPDIENFIGRIEVSSAYKKGDHNISLIVRHSLRTGDNNRGSFRFSYAYKALDYLKIHTQIFSGYGENLIDFNHRQTTFGIGVSLVDWLDVLD